MKLDRRQLLASGGACLASCGIGAPRSQASSLRQLDRVLEANAHVLPERAGAGANHYPMAAEALEALGYEEQIDTAWIAGARNYAGSLSREAPIGRAADALGRYERYGDWLDLFRDELTHDSWPAALDVWSTRLAAGLSGAAFHGLIRTAHAARALQRRDSAARRNELAVGLAYWAARYAELPVDPRLRVPAANLGETLAAPRPPSIAADEDVEFDVVMKRLTSTPLAPIVELETPPPHPSVELELIVREAATAFLEMLVLERQRIWLLHTVTAPAAVGMLLPFVGPRASQLLVAHVRQAVVAMYAAYGAAFTPLAHVRSSPGEWPELVQRAAQSGSVHTIKLVEALRRFDRKGDPLMRSVAAQWLEWT